MASLVGGWMITGNTYLYAFQYMKLTFPQLTWDILNRLLIYPFYVALAIVVVF